MDLKTILKIQYLASLEMFKEAVTRCPDSLWDDPEHNNKFWHIAYHTLFYTHLYLQDSEQEFSPWAKHRAHHNFLGRMPWPPHQIPAIGEPYTREEILEYYQLCGDQVDKKVASLNLGNQSGFHWLPFNKAELQIYNIRHIQHHVGQLIERLRGKGIEGISWVATTHLH
jgi:hypothetical protein